MSRYPELGDAFSVVHSNLAELDKRRDHLTECRLAHLYEWVEAARHRAGEDRELLLQLLEAWHPDDSAPPPDIPEENREELLGFARQAAIPERLCLLHAVIDRCGAEIFTDPPPEGFEISERAAEKIAYVQNSYSDNAYLQFSRTLAHPRAAYFDSFSDVCEEVYNGICEYGILPILHERDGKLFRFYALLEKYDLRIVCACDVPTVERDGGTTVTRYALIRKTVMQGGRAALPTHLDLLLPAEGMGGEQLCDLLQAARFSSLTPDRIDTRPAEGYEDVGELIYQITLLLPSEEKHLSTFLAYLLTEMPRVTVLGLYSVLSEPNYKS